MGRRRTVRKNNGHTRGSSLMPDPMAQRTGCPFADRCKYAFERCRVEHPRFIDAGNGHRVRCFKVENELRKGAGE